MIPGFTSTASKRPDALFGGHRRTPRRMIRAAGYQVWDDEQNVFVDMTMALGAVSLGYGHPAVTEAVQRAARDGTVGPLSPVLEGRVAERIGALIPGAECVRFLKTGAEAVLAAIRVARVYTGRERIVTCGYHGWIDALSESAGVPTGGRRVRNEVPFNDVEAVERAVREGEPVAALVVEPVVDGPPSPEWVTTVRRLASGEGAVLIVDELKTGLRLGFGGVAERYDLAGDLTVLGKALGNGLPVTAVCGPRDIMEAVSKTWISSTLATEFVSLAAAEAVLDVYEREDVPTHLAWTGGRLYVGLEEVASSAPGFAIAVKGIPEFCYLQCVDDDAGSRLASRCADHGLLFKRNAYNFVSLAHTDDVVRGVVECVAAVVEELAYG